MDKDVLCTALQLVASSSSTAVGRAEKAKTNNKFTGPNPFSPQFSKTKGMRNTENNCASTFPL